MDSVMKGLMGQCPSRISGLEPLLEMGMRSVVSSPTGVVWNKPTLKKKISHKPRSVEWKLIPFERL